jgi:hypothetical protein
VALQRSEERRATIKPQEKSKMAALHPSAKSADPLNIQKTANKSIGCGLYPDDVSTAATHISGIPPDDLFDEIFDEMFAVMATKLGIPTCVISDAIIANTSSTTDPIEALDLALDHEKVVRVCEAFVETCPRAQQAAWCTLRENVTVGEAAARYGLARESVSRARGKLLLELQRLFRS